MAIYYVRLIAMGSNELFVNTVLNVQLMGNLCLRDSDGIDRTPGGQKARALVGLLALTPDHRRPRRWVEQKLWSDRSPEQASNSLRQVLMELRSALGPVADCLQADRQSIGLLPLETDLDLDPECGRTALAAGYDLMQDVHVRDAAFAEWLKTQRAQIAGTSQASNDEWRIKAPAIPMLIRANVIPTGIGSFVSVSLAESISKLVSEFVHIDIYSENVTGLQLGPRDRGLILTKTAACREPRSIAHRSDYVVAPNAGSCRNCP
jgi:hypothetical protein